MDQVTEKQHFVPRFYLKRFADSQGFLRVLDIKNRKLLPKRAYGSVGYASFFYAARTGKADEISQHIESWLAEIENYTASKLPRILEKLLNLDHIDEDDKYTVSVLLSMLWLRSPAMRQQLNSMEEQMTKRIMGLDPEAMVEKYVADTGRHITSDQKTKIIDTFKKGNYKVTFSNAQHLRFMVETLGLGEKGFANMFYGKKWKVYLAKGNEQFITSGSPVIEWFRPPTGFYGRSFLDRTHYLALTPEILLELTYPRGSTKVKRQTLFTKDDNFVKMLNIVIAAHSPEYAFATNEKSLSDLLNGLANPGVPERMYYEQFEQPWEEYKKQVAESKRASFSPKPLA